MSTDIISRLRAKIIDELAVKPDRWTDNGTITKKIVDDYRSDPQLGSMIGVARAHHNDTLDELLDTLEWTAKTYVKVVMGSLKPTVDVSHGVRILIPNPPEASFLLLGRKHGCERVRTLTATKSDWVDWSEMLRQMAADQNKTAKIAEETLEKYYRWMAEKPWSTARDYIKETGNDSDGLFVVADRNWQPPEEELEDVGIA